MDTKEAKKETALGILGPSHLTQFKGLPEY